MAWTRDELLSGEISAVTKLPMIPSLPPYLSMNVSISAMMEARLPNIDSICIVGLSLLNRCQMLSFDLGLDGLSLPKLTGSDCDQDARSLDKDWLPS